MKIEFDCQCIHGLIFEASAGVTVQQAARDAMIIAFKLGLHGVQVQHNGRVYVVELKILDKTTSA